jgi:glycogen operon protein
VAVFLNGDAISAPNGRGERVVDDSFLLCFNADEQPVEFVMPPGDYAQEWTVELDTNDPVGDADQVVNAEEKISLPSRSLLVLRKTL